MKDAPQTFWKSAATSVAMMLALLAFEWTPMPVGNASTQAGIDLVRRTVKTRGLSAEAREDETVGYYQGLLDTASEVTAPTPSALTALLGGRRENTAKPTLEELEANQVPIHEHLPGFLIYRPRPNLDLPDPRFRNVRYVTNSLGFSDRDYSFERTPGTRRLVILGDSMPRALGVEQGLGFEAQLETELNAGATSGQKFELINMGVSGYRITQMVDVAAEVAPRFKPDAYVVVLSWLTVARKWGLHLAQLVDEKRDLKYDFLRTVVQEAHLKPGDTMAQTEAKLAPYVGPAMRWALTEISTRARADGASVVVVLMPHLKGIGTYEPVFKPVRDVLQEQGIPTIDLLDAFDGKDIGPLDVGDGLHPNAAGHRILLDTLKKRLAERPELSQVLLGRPSLDGLLTMPAGATGQ